MAAPLALAAGLEKAGGVVVALLVLAAVLAPTARARAGWTLATLVLTPALLLALLAGTAQWHVVRDRPAVAAVAGLAGLGVIVALALALRRRPEVFPLLVVATLPFRIPIAAGGSTFNLLAPLYVVVGAASLARVIATFRDDPPPTPLRPAARRVGAALLAFVVLYALQALYTKDLSTATNTLVFFLVPFALLWARLSEVEWNPRLLRNCLAVLLVLAVVLVGVGFGEYATRTLLLNPKVIDANSFSSFFRVNSLFFDPNVFGRFLALVMLAAASALLWTRAPRTGLALAAALAVLWGGLVITFSQSSFAALLVGLAVLAAVRWEARRVGLGALVGVLLAVVVVVVGQKALKLDLGSSRSVDRATSGRLDLVRGGLRMARDRPVFGWGSGSFALVYRQRESRSRQTAVSASHTIPLTVAAEQGVPGLALYVVLLVLAFVLLVRGVRGGRGSAPTRAFLLAAFAALVVHTLVYAAFLEDPVTWALLGAAAALPDP